ncbi:MAG: M20/M25/M40 family metallo-hydrolase [Clostridia bacterium]|nr:M20/M25/M40 family metallo-hydrolase [Clostridia bacterium]
MLILWIVLGLLALFLAIILIRAALFRPLPETAIDEAAVEYDRQKAIDDLQAMIRCKTVSDRDPAKEDEGEFRKLYDLLPAMFPRVYETCTLHRPDDRALLFHWKGREEGDPTVLMAHYDVVSVEEADWQKPPFDGIIEDGVLWGRGTLDTKGTFNGVLQAAEQLIKSGFVPKHDIYLAFGGDEEVNGNGAVAIVDWFMKNNIHPAMVVDEGGAVVENVFPGVKRPCAVVGIAEKGLMNVSFEVRTNGGHASAPPPHTAVGTLSKACLRVEDHPAPRHLTRPAAEMFNILGRHSTFVYRLIFANLWCFLPVLDMICKKSGGELNALMRTSCAFTTMQGSKGLNVMPAYAKMTANLRIIPGETVESTLDYIKKTVNDPAVEITCMDGNDPSPVSDTHCPEWEQLSSAIASTWQGTLVSPYLMLACSDSRHYGKLSDKVYRFSAMALSKEERATIHGNDERIPVETIEKTVEFYLRLIAKR